jgi:hypothetical protein
MTDKYPIIRVRAKAHQVETFYKLGGAKWLRDQLEQHQNESATVQPTDDTPKRGGDTTSETAHGTDDSAFVTPDGVWRIRLQKNL